MVNPVFFPRPIGPEMVHGGRGGLATGETSSFTHTLTHMPRQNEDNWHIKDDNNNNNDDNNDNNPACKKKENGNFYE
jgi:hypothetical protein